MKSKPPKFWIERDKQKRFMDDLGQRLGLESMNDWYKLRANHFKWNGGYGLLRAFGGSPLKVLQSVYLDHPWQSFKFLHVPRDHWNRIENQVIFLDWLANELGFKSRHDYYSIRSEDIIERGGSSLLRHHYASSPSMLLMTAYKDHDWKGFKFKSIPQGYWNKRRNQVDFMNWLGNELGFKGMEDYYIIKARDIVSKGGIGLLGRSSPSLLCNTIYPSHPWLLFRFQHVHVQFWNDIENQKEFMIWLSDQLGFQKMEDFYRLKAEDILSLGGSKLLGRYQGSPYQLLKSIFPEHVWHIWQFNTIPKAKTLPLAFT